jgi:hypothetical protein
VIHTFYATVFMLLGSSGKPIEPNAKAPAFRGFHNRIRAGEISLATDEAKLQHARVHMNQMLQEMRVMRFQDAPRIVSDRHAKA